MERIHMLSEIEKVKKELCETRQFYEGQKEKIAFDLVSSLKELKFQKEHYLEVFLRKNN
jgi:hypothetical protein